MAKLSEARGPLHVRAPCYPCCQECFLWHSLQAVKHSAGAAKGGAQADRVAKVAVIGEQQGCTFRKPCTTWEGLPGPSSLSAYMSTALHRQECPQADAHLHRELSRAS